ncbi:hypothetical protein PROH_00990 [Prochlorothrix hollandica PCC 9006 = CALU 1027]|uniref:Uncharacterized protein n=1 Tax=Prochlorothrix hollandica PCC 9006 = CALU 1027 TaxID=317619 RepID=A0A0M2Q4V9_PROHO|nr:hypothetical protein PROH_00990 [Prochlorothrix hollandica PCC 9006 = CALU 1027]
MTLSQPLAVPTDVPAPDLLAILQTDRTLAPGSLLLVDLERDSLVRWESAIPWLLDIVSHYLSHGEDPAFLATERIRLEAWRQELTLEQQELGRKLLEVEARIAKFYDSETPSQLQQP